VFLVFLFVTSKKSCASKLANRAKHALPPKGAIDHPFGVMHCHDIAFGDVSRRQSIALSFAEQNLKTKFCKGKTFSNRLLAS